MHAAPGTLEVHYVELFVQECVEFIRSCFHARGCTFKHLFIHIFELTFVLGDFEELSQSAVRTGDCNAALLQRQSLQLKQAA